MQVFSKSTLKTRDSLFDDLDNSLPAQLGDNKSDQQAIVKIANSHIFTSNDVGKEYCSEDEAKRFYEKIKNSVTRISFNGLFVSAILQDGYKHWTLLEKTDNTADIELIIQRLHCDYVLFDIKVYNDNVLSRCKRLFDVDKELFLKHWNERFDLTIQNCNCENAEQLFIAAGFHKGELPIEVIFGALFHEGKVLKSDNCKEDYISKFYGESQLVIKDSCRDNTTFCLDDSFDATSFSFHTKEKPVKNNPQVALFTLSNRLNIISRLMAYTGFKGIGYIENHFYERITAKHIEKVFLAESEMKLSKEELNAYCEQLSIDHNIKFEII